MKLYNLLLEILDDKVFKQKLDTMSLETKKGMIEFTRGLDESEKKEFKSLLNKYSSPSQLKAPNSSLELKLNKLKAGKGTNIGPGEILFHLQLKNSSMVGDTNHDLTIGSEVWEVKEVRPEGGPFRGAKKAKISQFKFSSNLYKMVTIIDRIADKLPDIKDDIEEVSPQLFTALKNWNENVSPSYTPKSAILAGELSNKVRKYLIDTINTIKREIEKNTDDEFTTVKFGGVNVNTKDRGIEPIKIDKVDDNSITLNFIGKDVLKFLEVLNEFPYIKEGDFKEDVQKATVEILSQLPSLIVYSSKGGKLVAIPKERVTEDIVFYTISQGEIRFKVSPKIWK